MQVVVNGSVVHNAPDLKGYKVDTTRQTMRLNIDSNTISVSATEGRFDSNQITGQASNQLNAVKALDSDAGKIIRFETQAQIQLEVDEKANREMREMRDAHGEYWSWRTSVIDRVDPAFNTLTLAEQETFRRDFIIKDHAELRKNNPDVFRAGISNDEIIEEIMSGYSPTLGNFTMDDWFDSMGEEWERWINNKSFGWRANDSKAVREYVYEQAELRGLL